MCPYYFLSYNWKFVPLTTFLQFSLSPTPTSVNCKSDLFLRVLFFHFRCPMLVRACGICLSLSDTSLSRMPLRSIHVVINCRHPHFLWLNNILLYDHSIAYLSISGHFGLFLYLGYCKYCCSKHRGTDIFSG